MEDELGIGRGTIKRLGLGNGCSLSSVACKRSASDGTRDVRAVPVDGVASRLLSIERAKSLVANDLAVIRIVLVERNAVARIVEEARVRVDARVRTSNGLVKTIDPAGVEDFGRAGGGGSGECSEEQEGGVSDRDLELIFSPSLYPLTISALTSFARSVK